MDAYGSPGQPTKFALAKDEASEKLIAAVTANAPAAGANIMIGGQSLADMQAAAAQAAAGATAAQADPTDKLSRLDTVEPVMRTAVGMYRQLGFREIAPYRANPIEGALYMELRL